MCTIVWGTIHVRWFVETSGARPVSSLWLIQCKGFLPIAMELHELQYLCDRLLALEGQY